VYAALLTIVTSGGVLIRHCNFDGICKWSLRSVSCFHSVTESAAMTNGIHYGTSGGSGCRKPALIGCDLQMSAFPWFIHFVKWLICILKGQFGIVCSDEMLTLAVQMTFTSKGDLSDFEEPSVYTCIKHVSNFY
jgi:hypothetical protein